jgi:hypothetical protein
VSHYLSRYFNLSDPRNPGTGCSEDGVKVKCERLFRGLNNGSIGNVTVSTTGGMGGVGGDTGALIGAFSLAAGQATSTTRNRRIAGERQGLRFGDQAFVNDTPPRYEEVNDVNFFFGGGGQHGGQVQNMGVQPSCKEFVDNLVHLIRFNVNFTQRMGGGPVSRGINKTVLGIEMMNRAVKNVDIFGRSYVKGPGAPVGFKLDLVNNGQLGDVYHISSY